MNKNWTLLTISVCFLIISTQSEILNNRLLQNTRGRNLSKTCLSSNRNDFLVQQMITDGKKSRQETKNSFKTSGYELLKPAMQTDKNGILSKMIDAVTSVTTDLGIYIAPFGVGLVILVLIWPFLLCCCCCPQSCPIKPCQKKDQQKYTKTELFLPVIFLVAALLLLIIASSLGFKRVSDMETNIKSSFCTLSITLDDILNGNISSEGKYFTGIRDILEGLQLVKTNSGAIKTQMDTVKYSVTGAGTIRQSHDLGATLVSDISKVPSGTAGGTMTAFSYNHFDGTTGSTPSTFPGLLGSQTSGRLATTHSLVKKFNDEMKKMLDNAQEYSTQHGNVATQIDKMIPQFTDMTKDLADGVDALSPIVDGASFISSLTSGFLAFFIVSLALALLGITGALILVVCNTFKCRYLLYAICGIFVVIGILTFVISILFSIVVPFLHFGCQFIEVTLTAEDNFDIMYKLIEEQVNLKSCIPGGSNNILGKVNGTDGSALIAMADAAAYMGKFDATQSATLINDQMTAFQTFIQNYGYTKYLDFNSQIDKAHMIKVSTPGRYPGCTATTFATDSWIPSGQLSEVPCVGATHNAAEDKCPDSTSIRNGGPPGTCYGCLDTSRIFSINFATINTDVSARYGTPTTGDCFTWVGDMNNLLTKYYGPKGLAFSPIVSRVTTAQTSAGSYVASFPNVASKSTAAMTSLRGINSYLFNSSYGFVSGLNCAVIGEDMQLVHKTFCYQFFGTLFYFRIVFGIMSFAILFSVCCSTCTSVQMYKHSQRILINTQKQQQAIKIQQEQSSLVYINQQKGKGKR